MTEKVLVVGATGTIGRPLVENLSRFGYPVRAATRIPVPYAISHPNRDVVLFDYDDPTSYAKAVSGVSKAFIVPKGIDPEPQKTIIPLMEAARSAGVSHIVLLSAMGIEHPARRALAEVEDYLTSSGILYTILRPNWYMQNFNPGFIVPMIQKTGTIFLPAADGATSFVDARDVAAVATIALTEEGHLDQVYTLTGGEALTYEAVARLISRASGRTIRYVPASDDAFRQALLAGGWEADQAILMTALFELVRQGATAAITEDIQKLLGRGPLKMAKFAVENGDTWRYRF